MSKLQSKSQTKLVSSLPQGCISALITIYNKHGELDLKATCSLAKMQLASGVSGLVLAGTTGEGALLEESEILDLLTYIRKQLPEAFLFSGLPENSTARAKKMATTLLSAGSDAIMLLGPPYIKPNAEGIKRHCSEIASVGADVIYYDIPQRTACHVDSDVIASLLQSQALVGVKDCTNKIANIDKYLAANKDATCYCGDDAQADAYVSYGWHGVISVIANAFPKSFSMFVTDAKASNKTVDTRWEELVQLMFIEPNPVPVKWLVTAALGLNSSVRLPLVHLSESSQIRLQRFVNEVKKDYRFTEN